MSTHLSSSYHPWPFAFPCLLTDESLLHLQLKMPKLGEKAKGKHSPLTNSSSTLSPEPPFLFEDVAFGGDAPTYCLPFVRAEGDPRRALW